MGNKTNPNSLRLGRFPGRKWDNVYYETSEAQNIETVFTCYLIRKTIFSMLPNKVFIEKILIVKELQKYVVSMFVCNSGLIFSYQKQESSASFSKNSSFLRRLELRILRVFKKQGYLNLSVSFKVFEVQKPDLSAPIVAQKIARQIESGEHFKRCVLFAIRNALKEKGFRGIRVILSGRLGGNDIASNFKEERGSMPCARFAENIFHGDSVALTRSGTIGVYVLIYRSDNFNLGSRERTEWQRKRR